LPEIFPLPVPETYCIKVGIDAVSNRSSGMVLVAPVAIPFTADFEPVYIADFPFDSPEHPFNGHCNIILHQADFFGIHCFLLLPIAASVTSVAQIMNVIMTDSMFS